MSTEEVVYFIPKVGQRELVSLLREIPDLVDDLAITITRQDRTGKGGVRIRSGSDEQPLPLNIGASAASDGLRNELAGWVRHVCESRGITYDGSDSIIGIGKWLDQNVVSLAMTEGSEEAYRGIEGAMGRCRRAMDLPADDVVCVSPAMHLEARNTLLHRAAIGAVAKQLGSEFAGLTPKRVDTLRRAGRIHGDRCVVSTRAELFILGDVLDAHLMFPSRARSS
ncbi:hypothetical protein [Rhodococcus sp. no. 34]